MTATATTVSQQLAAFAVEPPDPDVAAAIQVDSTRRLRDLIGLALAAGDTDVADVAAGLAEIWAGQAEATLIGRPGKAGRAAAAFYNGTLAHALDFDDTHLPSILHPSASVVPAALAAAEVTGAPGERLLHAIAVGNEVCVRLGMGGFQPELGNSIFFERGQHATAICGTIGAAVAACVVQGLDAEQIAHAIGVAASMGSGILEANRTGGSVKRIHCGWAAHAGLTAAELVRLGLTGPPTALEGRFGFFQAYCGDEADLDAVTDRLGEHWHALDLAFKPYPANHFTHAVIDAALELRARGVRPEDLARIEIGIAAPTLRTIAEPWDEKVRPPNGYTARFSGPFTFALALAGGGGLGVYLDDFTDEKAHEPELIGIAARTRFSASALCDSLFPYALPAVVDAHTVGGDVISIEVLENRGSRARPLSDDELGEKFRLNACRALPSSSVALLDAAIAGVGEAPSVARLLACTAPTDAGRATPPEAATPA